MEKVEYPNILIYPESEISIYFEAKIRVNKTETSVIIEGNQEGFLSLSNLINVYNVYLYNNIVITDFAFVRSDLIFEIVEEIDLSLPNGYVLRESKKHFEWKISETNLFVVTGMIHSLGYANNELHLDTGLQPSDISVYCIVK